MAKAESKICSKCCWNYAFKDIEGTPYCRKCLPKESSDSASLSDEDWKFWVEHFSQRHRKAADDLDLILGPDPFELGDD